MKKNEGGPFGDIKTLTVSQCQKKCKMRDRLGFLNINSVANYWNDWRGDPKIFKKESHSAEKK